MSVADAVAERVSADKSRSRGPKRGQKRDQKQNQNRDASAGSDSVPELSTAGMSQASSVTTESVIDPEVRSTGDFAASSVQRGWRFLEPESFTRPVSIVIGLTGLLLLFGSAVFVGRYTADPREFPVNEVEVAGTMDYTDRDKLRERVENSTRDGFYSLQLDEIQSDVERMPWIAKAHIRRISPDRVSIQVIEHEPAARWNEEALISKGYELFSPPQLHTDHIQLAEWQAYFAQFPQIAGMPGRHKEVLSALRAYQVYLDPFRVQIDTLIEDDRHSQILMLDNNVAVRLGGSKQEERMQRFADVYRRLVPALNGQPVKFDMRYANGFTMTNPGSSQAVSSSYAGLRYNTRNQTSQLNGSDRQSGKQTGIKGTPEQDALKIDAPAVRDAGGVQQ